MPNQITHNYFALEVLKILDEETFSIIKNNLESYKLGALGPDIMFALRESGIGNAPRYANVMQYLYVYEVFQGCKEYLKVNNNERILSYVLGLLCHYVLDKSAHAYVNFLSEELMPKYFPATMQTALHPLVEAALDEAILEEYMKVNPRLYRSSRDYSPSTEDKEQIANLYNDVINDIIGFKVKRKLIKLTIVLSKLYFSFTSDPTGLKKKLISKFEDIRSMKKQVSSTIRPPYKYKDYDYLNRNKLSWRRVRNEPHMTDESFDSLLNNNISEAKVYLERFMKCLTEDKALNREDFAVNYEGVKIF